MLRTLLLSLTFVFTSVGYAQDTTGTPEVKGDPENGKALFAKCAACHDLDKQMIGPALRGVSTRLDREWLHKWIRNSQELIASGDAYANEVFEKFNKIPMQAFEDLSEQEIDDILAYTAQEKETGPKLTAEELAQVRAESQAKRDKAHRVDSTGKVIFWSFVAIFVVLVFFLYAVNKKLKNLVASRGVDMGEKNPVLEGFARNKFVAVTTVLLLVLVGAYFGYGYLMQVGIDKGYQPIQPIHYSHKIHAGDNQIDCKYCHSSARTSKTAGIPSLNVCMNCHENISEYNGEEDLEKGYTKDFYTGEIQKLYDAVGWDPETRQYSKPQQPVKWVRIHNLPDFVYFNHSQHVSVAGLECQTCHGEVQNMELLEQHATLSMGWCIDCHRNTPVQSDNNYYKGVHEELAKKYGKEKLTIADMGGLECGKCHY